MPPFWLNKKVLVTGGASFIGSHLVDALVAHGARVRVVDDLSSGALSNIQPHLNSGSIEFLRNNLLDPTVAAKAVQNREFVFHLAADHGGRGYVDLRQAECASNLALDNCVFREAAKARVQKIVFASSGCVYPNYLQKDPSKKIYLTEDMVGPPYEADNLYGWAKLMGEFTLRSYFQQYGLKSVSCRYFTVYGPRGKENHAVMAMIARAFIGEDPFEIWGDGSQIRNWTYVEDIVSGTLLAAEKIDDASAVNLGTTERIQVREAARMVLELSGHKASFRFRTDMPTGPLNRVADTRRAQKLLGWQAQTSFRKGLESTMKWYFNEHDRQTVRTHLSQILIERKQNTNLQLDVPQETYR